MSPAIRACLVALLAAACLALAAGDALAASPPTIGAGEATNLQGTQALLKATVNPEGSATTANFEYVTEAQYQDDLPDGFAAATATPPVKLSAAVVQRTVTASLRNLSPQTAYRFRLNASSAAGSARGAEGSFTTSAGFGFLAGRQGFDAAVTDEDGQPQTEAGSHPYALSLHLALHLGGEFDQQAGTEFGDGDLRSLRLKLPPGLLANPMAVEECSPAAFHTPRTSPFQQSLSGENCPNRTQVGVVAVHSNYKGGSTRYFGVFNLAAPSGDVEAIGFSPFGVPIVLAAHVEEGDASLIFQLEGLPQRLSIYGLDLTLWGTPWMPAKGLEEPFPHDDERGNCLNEVDPDEPFGKAAYFSPPEPGKTKPIYHEGTCSAGDPETYPPGAYLTLPASCQETLRWTAVAAPWGEGATVESSVLGSGGGTETPLAKCHRELPAALAQMTTEEAASPTGLAFQLNLDPGGGTLNPAGVALPPTRTAVVTLPEGLTINPSVGAGLGVCSEADLARETAASEPGAGCPNPSKIGDVSIEGLLGLHETLQGSLFLAAPYENPFHSLIALYIVAKSPRRGLLLKSLGEVEPNPQTGSLVATFENLPQLLYTSFKLRFREGQRAVMVSPPSCDSFVTQLELTPWSEPDVQERTTSTSPITRGERGGSCPSGALRPFQPALEAGSINPAPAAYTPFYLHMTRTDADQEITSYSATFPPGLLAKLAGVGTCPDAAIEAAKHQSAAEAETVPACPASSQIGRSLVGEGVGQVLDYVPGAFYLGGPYHGSQLSVVSVTAARVGPFDLGTVVVRSAIRIDPRTARASIDATGSDPIPHLLKGIPIHVRDIRVYIDRPGFTVNPTSCDPFATVSTLTGAGTDLFSAADDVPATATDRYQLLGCSALGFRPRLSLRAMGATKRGGYPALRAVFTPRPGDVNVARAAVTLPPSLFLAQEHLRTVCTAGQFAAGACPHGSVYGQARAATPLLEQPLQGPVYLRASSGALPDLVAQLHGGGVTIEVVGRIDSSHGGMRGTFELLPDAPVTSFAMSLGGGRKRGILVNAEDLCTAKRPARVRLVAQDNATEALHPRLVAPACRKRKRRRAKRHHAGPAGRGQRHGSGGR